jgi:predicted transglutaminase-like cysteine proteinase
VIGARLFVASAAMFLALPQSGDLASSESYYVGAAAFVDDSPPARRQDASFDGEKQAQLPFGMETELIAGEVAAKWRTVEADIDREQQVLERCRVHDTSPAVAQRLLDVVAKGAGRSGRARVGLINRAADLAITATSDMTQWGVAGHWSPPFETLQTHRGDCEDYAIVKYVALLQAGLSRSDVKIVILRTILPNEDHAVVAARVDGQWQILDSRRLALVRDIDMVGCIPRFLLDEEGTRRFVLPNRAGEGPGARRSSPCNFVPPAWSSA